MRIEQNDLPKSQPASEEMSAKDALSQQAFSGEEVGRHGHGGYYPYPYPMPHFEPPVSRISVSPPGHVVPSVELVMGANKEGAAQEEVGRHGHGGWYPYPYPMPHFEPPVSRISVSPPGHVVPSVELVMGANKDAIGQAAQEVVGHHHHPSIPYPYPMPHFEPPVVRISVSPPGKVR